MLPALFVALSCAHTTAPHQGASIDVRDGAGRVFWLDELEGQVVVLDICAAWSDPCLINAQVIDQVCQSICGADVVMASVLLDDKPAAARQAYVDVLGVSQAVWTPGPEMAAGKSPLGPLNGIPRLIILDPSGRRVDDLGGAIIKAETLRGRVLSLRARSEND